ncbi:MAG: PDZ domain-containing protein [Proteobacteria bacterium]|nr:PDZ domain-containing protein [Pseudomonadota bacterium]
MRLWGLLLALLVVAGSGFAAGKGDVRVSFASAVKATAPSVVNIYSTKVLNAPGAAKIDPVLNQMMVGSVKERVEKSLGSGVIVGEGGIVVTNLHVIAGADSVKVVLGNGEDYGARLLGTDEKLDLAVLKLDVPRGAHLPVARWGDSDSLEVGDVVLALGNPFGIGQSVSMGVVSAVARSNAALSPYGQFIQTDASINPGDSGGALIDSTGAVVGVTTAIFTRSGGSQGIGFAIPAALAKTVVADIARTGYVVRPWLGAEGQAMSDSVAAELGLGQARGVLLTDVVEGSPADKAGLRKGDVILRLAGQEVSDPARLNDRILATPNLLDKPTSLVVWREGRMKEVVIQLTALPPRDVEHRLLVRGYNPLTGVTVEPLGPALNVDLGLALSTQGVAVVSVPDKAPLAAFNVPVRPGDLILSVNGQGIKTPRDLQGALDSDRRKWEIRYQRDGKVVSVVVR